MKANETMRTIVMSLLAAASLSVAAQQTMEPAPEMKTLFNSKPGTGGFLEIGTKFTQVNDKDVLLVGGSLNAVIGQSINLGIVGYGMATQIQSRHVFDANRKYFLQFGYGGINVEPVIASNKIIHATIPVTLGIGGYGYTRQALWNDHDTTIHTNLDEPIFNGRTLLLAEPGLNLEVNVFKWMRFAAGASYRFTHRLNEDSDPYEEFDGFSANVGFRFGWF